LLDCHTTWGTQLFWPLPWKLSWNNIFVVDPLYTVPFMICVGTVMFMRRDNDRRRWVNWLGIGISSAYMLFTIVCKRIAVGTIAASLERQHIPYTDFSTRPTPFNSILWSVNVDAGDHYLLGTIRLLDTKPEVEFVRVDKGLQNLGASGRQHEKVRRLQVLVGPQLRRAVSMATPSSSTTCASDRWANPGRTSPSCSRTCSFPATAICAWS
jgi:inner membrane protein